MKIDGFDWSRAKVLVTGASGFKGSWLCATLLQMGAQVHGIVRPHVDTLSAYSLLDLARQITNVSGEITDRQHIYDIINKCCPDVIFHLAATSLVPVSLRDPRRTYDINIMGTLNLIEACRRIKVGSRLLVCSTDHVFGSVGERQLPKGGFDERSRVSYGGPYDTSKAAMELMTRSYHNTYWDQVPAIGITRCANVFGYGDINQRRVIPEFVRSALNSKVIPIKYRKNGRQFIHITDAIAGYIMAASSLKEGGCAHKCGQTKPKSSTSPFTPTFHFAIETYDGHERPFITIETLAKTIGDLFGAKVDHKNAVPFAPNENKVQALNCSMTRKSLGWKTRRTLESGLKDLGTWFQNQHDIDSLKNLIGRDVTTIVDSFRPRFRV